MSCDLSYDLKAHEDCVELIICSEESNEWKQAGHREAPYIVQMEDDLTWKKMTVYK